MPIVITPQGEYVDSETGNPVQMTTPPMDDMARRLSEGMGGQRSVTAMDIKRRDPGSVAREGEMNAIANMNMQRLDPRSVVREGEMARENIPSNLDMGMDSMMPAADLSEMDKVRLLVDMGLTPAEAMEAVARERMTERVMPQNFGRMVDPGSVAREGELNAIANMERMQMGGTTTPPMPMPRPQMMGAPRGALPQTPPPMPMTRPFDFSGMSAEQIDMVRRGIDPFAEGMMAR